MTIIRRAFDAQIGSILDCCRDPPNCKATAIRGAKILSSVHLINATWWRLRHRAAAQNTWQGTGGPHRKNGRRLFQPRRRDRLNGPLRRSDALISVALWLTNSTAWPAPNLMARRNGTALRQRMDAEIDPHDRDSVYGEIFIWQLRAADYIMSILGFAFRDGQLN